MPRAGPWMTCQRRRTTEASLTACTVSTSPGSEARECYEAVVLDTSRARGGVEVGSHLQTLLQLAEQMEHPAWWCPCIVDASEKFLLRSFCVSGWHSGAV